MTTKRKIKPERDVYRYRRWLRRWSHMMHTIIKRNDRLIGASAILACGVIAEESDRALKGDWP